MFIFISDQTVSLPPSNGNCLLCQWNFAKIILSLFWFLAQKYTLIPLHPPKKKTPQLLSGCLFWQIKSCRNFLNRKEINKRKYMVSLGGLKFYCWKEGVSFCVAPRRCPQEIWGQVESHWPTEHIHSSMQVPDSDQMFLLWDVTLGTKETQALRELQLRKNRQEKRKFWCENCPNRVQIRAGWGRRG